jgi:hypothetical protein
MTKRISEEDFVEAWRVFGSPSKVSKFLGLTLRAVYQRRDNLTAKGIDLSTRPGTATHRNYERTQTFEKRRDFEVKDGAVIVYSDAHFWPGAPSLAYQALVEIIPEVKPKAIIANGDLLDGARISRHEPRGWQSVPSVRDELEVLVERQDEIRKRAGRCRFFRTLGNHDVRFERYIAIHAPELEDIKGTALEDFIPDWPCSWSVAINNRVMVKHRIAGGVHAIYNNTLKAGWSTVTGHLHNLNVRRFTDYDGLRFGVDTGTLADPEHDAFDYTEDSPKDWASGFAVLSFRDGRLLWPEVCYVDGSGAWFRGEAIFGRRKAA